MTTLIKTRTKFSYIFICLTFTFCFCKARTTDKINLTKIIFHSSRCNGTCPIIDLEIDSNKHIFVNREYYKTKSETDNHFSGHFSGTLNQSNYNKLIELLQNCNLETLQFPGITCCDGAVTTIIVYYNGQRKYFKSMTPPKIALGLVSFLKTIGNDKKLMRTTERREIED